METTKHRRAQIIDALTLLFGSHLLETASREAFFRSMGTEDAFGEPDETLPSRVKTVQKRFIHWTTLDQQGAIPALLINFGRGGTQTEGGDRTEFASLGEIEEQLPIAVLVIVKEDSTREPPYPLTDQVSDMVYSLERLVNGTQDLEVEGVCKVRLQGLPETSEGFLSALEGTPFEVLKFRIIVTHVYDASTSV